MPDHTTNEAITQSAAAALPAITGMSSSFLPYFNTFFAGGVAIYLLTVELPKMRETQEHVSTTLGCAIDKLTQGIQSQSDTNRALATEVREARLTRERAAHP